MWDYSYKHASRQLKYNYVQIANKLCMLALQCVVLNIII